MWVIGAIASRIILPYTVSEWNHGISTVMMWPIRLAIGIFHFYSSLNILDTVYQIPMSFAGHALPSLFRSPFAASSVSEFWRRWNIVIQGMLHSTVYRPCASWGESMRFPGVLLTFLASGVLHIYPIWLSGLGVTQCVLMGAFFLAQGLCVCLENSKGIPVNDARIFAALTSPLFIEPFLRAFQL